MRAFLSNLVAFLLFFLLAVVGCGGIFLDASEVDRSVNHALGR